MKALGRSEEAMNTLKDKDKLKKLCEEGRVEN